MKSVIDGLLYDTGTAELLAKSQWYFIGDSFGGCAGQSRTSFYRSKNGKFFKLIEERPVPNKGRLYHLFNCQVYPHSMIVPQTEKYFATELYNETGIKLGNIKEA